MDTTQEKKQSKKKRIIIDVLIILVIIALLGTAGYLLYKEFFPNNELILKMQVTNGDDSINWEALLAKNPDTVGWIKIDGTAIDMPVVQTNNNDTYLYKSFDGNSDGKGTPFLDKDFKWDPRGRNSVIYGHSMFNSDISIMFDDLHKYVEDSEFIQKHGAIIYNRPPDKGGDGVFAIFSVLIVEADADYRRLTFESEAEFLNYYAVWKAASVVETNVDVATGDEILTLSTCINGSTLEDGRLAVLAKRVE